MRSDLKYTVDPEDKIKFSWKKRSFYEFLRLRVFRETLCYSNEYKEFVHPQIRHVNVRGSDFFQFVYLQISF